MSAPGIVHSVKCSGVPGTVGEKSLPTPTIDLRDTRLRDVGKRLQAHCRFHRGGMLRLSSSPKVEVICQVTGKQVEYANVWVSG